MGLYNISEVYLCLFSRKWKRIFEPEKRIIDVDKLRRFEIISIATILVLVVFFGIPVKVLVDKVVQQEFFLKKEPREALREDCWTYVGSSGTVFECLFVEETTGIKVKLPVTAFNYRLFEKDPTPKMEEVYLSRAMLGDKPPKGAGIDSIFFWAGIVAIAMTTLGCFAGYSLIAHQRLKNDKNN